MAQRKQLSEKQIEIRIKKIWREFLTWTSDLNTINWIFRGESSSKYNLVPKVGRDSSHREGYSLGKELGLLNDFKRISHLHIERGQEPKHDIDWLFLGQHYGLPTRLLDWSKSPFVAAFFAVESENNAEDAVVHAIDFRWGVSELDFSNPFTVQQVLKIQPRNNSQRVMAQSSVFTIHPKPDTPLSPKEGKRYKKFLIDSRIKKEFKNKLSNIGISRHSLFMNLEGAASQATFMNRIMNRSGINYRIPVVDFEEHASAHINVFVDGPIDIIENKIRDCEEFGDEVGKKYCETLLSVVKARIAEQSA